MLGLDLLLRDAGIGPRTVAVLLHTALRPLRLLPPSLWRGRPDLWAAYRGVHGPRVEPTLRGRPNVAGFVPVADRRMPFMGLFDASGRVERPTPDIHADPRLDELERDHGAADTTLANNARRPRRLWFDPRLRGEPSDLWGRLLIATPPGRNHVRPAEDLEAPIPALTGSPVHDAPVPDRRDLAPTAAMLRRLPRSWADAMRPWRGIRLIVDGADGGRYVGSACGAEDLLGRWRAHVAGEAGVTAELRGRPTDGYRFPVLELTSPVAPAEEVIRPERTRMDRLHTRRLGLNAGAGRAGGGLGERNGNM